jgi:hypothetical protein
LSHFKSNDHPAAGQAEHQAGCFTELLSLRVQFFTNFGPVLEEHAQPANFLLAGMVIPAMRAGPLP